MIAQDKIEMADESHAQQAYLSRRQVSLVEVLDRVLNKGAVLTGGITISVADIPLIYVGLNLLIASVEMLKGHLTKPFIDGDKTNVLRDLPQFPAPSPSPSPSPSRERVGVRVLRGRGTG